MPFLFQSDQKKEPPSMGFIAPERPTVYGPGVIVLLTIFGLSFVVYALLFSFRTSVAADIEFTKRSTDDLERTRDRKLESDILDFEKRVRTLSQILRSHHYVSQIFPLIYDVTLPTVFYSSMSLALSSAPAAAGEMGGGDFVRVDLQGSAPSLLDLARQIAVFRQDRRIKQGGVTSFTVGREYEQGVNFSASLSFDKKVILAP